MIYNYLIPPKVNFLNGFCKFCNLKKGDLKPRQGTDRLRPLYLFTGPQQTNLSLQSGLMSTGCSDCTGEGGLIRVNIRMFWHLGRHRKNHKHASIACKEF